MTIAHLFAQVRRHGFFVTFANGTPAVRATKTGAKLPDTVMEQLKARRQEVIEWFRQSPNDPEPEAEPNPTQAPARPEWETCLECRAMVHQSMTTEDALILCDRNGARASNGIPATNRCPYRPPISSGHGGG